jgi:hypothetical protein
LFSIFWIQGFGIIRNTRLLFSPGYIQARLSVELYLVTVAWHQFSDATEGFLLGGLSPPNKK